MISTKLKKKLPKGVLRFSGQSVLTGLSRNIHFFFEAVVSILIAFILLRNFSQR